MVRRSASIRVIVGRLSRSLLFVVGDRPVPPIWRRLWREGADIPPFDASLRDRLPKGEDWLHNGGALNPILA
jgi:hypothetical protein